MIEHIDSKALLVKKAGLVAQLEAAREFLAGEDEESDIARQVLTLREQQVQKQQQVDTLTAELNRLNADIPKLANGRHQLLLQAITQQRWFAFKNIPEILYDSHTGYLWPSFHYGFELPACKAHPDVFDGKNFSLGGIKGWLAPLENNTSFIKISALYASSYPALAKLKDKALFYIYCLDPSYSSYSSHDVSHYAYYYCYNNSSRNYNNFSGLFILPYNPSFVDARIHPRRDNFKPEELAQIILDFFLAQGWQPVFDNPELEQAYLLLQQSPTQHAELATLENQIAAALEYEATLHQPLTGQFDFQLDLQAYPLAAIADSSLQYAQATQRWAGQLLAKIDEFARKNNLLIQAATSLHQRLHQDFKLSRFAAVGDSLAILTARDDFMKAALAFDLNGVRAKLIHAEQSGKTLQNQLDSSALNANWLADLATIQTAPRPDFAFVAEYTAQIVLKEVQSLEWLEAHQAGLEQLVAGHLAWLQAFNVFTGQAQDDFLRHAAQEEIEEAVAQACFAAWAQQRLSIERQVLPLYQFAFSQVCSLEMANAVMDVLQRYQVAVDEFFKKESLPIYQKFAFVGNGELQSEYETRLALFKLCSQFQAELEGLLFTLKDVAVRIHLLRWSEAITQQHFVSVRASADTQLALPQQGDIWQTINQELRALQQRSLETFIQDAASFAQAREQRDKEFNSLVFKMRKALPKA